MNCKTLSSSKIPESSGTTPENECSIPILIWSSPRVIIVDRESDWADQDKFNHTFPMGHTCTLYLKKVEQ